MAFNYNDYLETPNSSVINRAWHDGGLDRLAIQTVSGRVYVYMDFTKSEWEKFKAHPSKGGFYNYFIKDKKPRDNGIDEFSKFVRYYDTVPHVEKSTIVDIEFDGTLRFTVSGEVSREDVEKAFEVLVIDGFWTLLNRQVISKEDYDS